MASTNYREDYLGRDLTTPTGTALDQLGRQVGATTDVLGRPLRRILRANSATHAAGVEIQFTGGTKYTVTIGGQLAGSAPNIPAVGDTVVDGAATLLRTK